MTSEEARKRIATETNFIFMKRFDNSLERFMDRYPDGAPVRVIAQALMMTEDEVESVLQGVIEKLRVSMNVHD
jgi:hypothetical protein